MNRRNHTKSERAKIVSAIKAGKKIECKCPEHADWIEVNDPAFDPECDYRIVMDVIQSDHQDKFG